MHGFVVRSRLSQPGCDEEVHLLITVSRCGEKRSHAPHARGNQADLLVTFPDRGVLDVLTGLQTPGRQLPGQTPDRVTVLLNQNDVAAVGDWNDHHRSRMANDLSLE